MPTCTERQWTLKGCKEVEVKNSVEPEGKAKEVIGAEPKFLEIIEVPEAKSQVLDK